MFRIIFQTESEITGLSLVCFWNSLLPMPFFITMVEPVTLWSLKILKSERLRAAISQLSNTILYKKYSRFFNCSLGITPMNSKKVFHFRFYKKLFNRLSNKSWALGCLENIFQKMKLSRRFSRSRRIEGVKIDCSIREKP